MAGVQLRRAGAVALGLAGVLWVLYPAVRPWRDESTVAGATAAMGSAAWVVAHLFAMLGLVLLALGVLAYAGVLAGTRGGGLALAAAVTAWTGAGLALPYYGAEDFALHALAAAARSGAPIDLLGLVDAIRFGAVAATVFATGLVLLGTAGVLLAAAIRRGPVRSRWAGVPAAAGLLLLIPQFYLPPWARIAHGVLLGAGLAWLAWVLTVGTATVRLDVDPAGHPADRAPIGVHR
jgi:hypothetical protein